jgi:hypothetical protein
MILSLFFSLIKAGRLSYSCRHHETEQHVDDWHVLEQITEQTFPCKAIAS